MANADDLGRLAQEVVNAYEERIKSISDIKRNTADFLAQTREEIKEREIHVENLLADFNDAREKMGREVRAELAKFKSDLDAAETDRKATDQAEIKEREAYMESLLSGFDKAHQEMADNLRAELAKVKPELDAAESERKATDQAEIKEREAYIESLLSDFDKAHQEMADNLRAELAKVEPALKADEFDRKAADQAEIRKRKDHINRLLAGFDKAHKEMADNLRAELAKVKPELDAAETDRKATDQAEIKEREAYMESLLSDFDKAHQEMADNLRAELAKVKPELDAAETDRKATDQAEIKEREAYIESLLSDFDKAHQEMADNLRAELAKVKPELDAAETDRKATDQAEIKEREAYMESLLSDFDKAHQEMADNLRAELAKVKPELDAAESDRKATDQAEIKEREEAVRAMLDEFRREQEEAASAWKKLLAGMQSLREKVTITGPAEVEAGVEVTTVEEAIEEEPAEEEEIEEEELEKGEDLIQKILNLIGDHPEGLRMVEIGEELGIESWRSLIPVMRELLDDEEIRKEGSTYFIA